MHKGVDKCSPVRLVCGFITGFRCWRGYECARTGGAGRHRHAFEGGIAVVSRTLGYNSLLAQQDRRQSDADQMERHDAARTETTCKEAYGYGSDDPENAQSHK